MATDERKIPLDIPRTRAQPDIDEREGGFQRIEGPGAGTAADQLGQDDVGIPASEEAGGLGTGPLPPRQPDRPLQHREQPVRDEPIVPDRNVAVDGSPDRT